jgi:uncharacterized protein YbaR (Trm112 family)
MPTNRPRLGNPLRIEFSVTDDGWVSDREPDASSVETGGAATALEPWVVELLACPVDRGVVRLDQAELVCIECGRRYAVRSGIPRMVPERDSGEQKF